jgi:hypothetical protein
MTNDKGKIRAPTRCARYPRLCDIIRWPDKAMFKNQPEHFRPTAYRADLFAD